MLYSREDMRGKNLTGVIIAAGEGKRMGELGKRYAKPLLPVCNRPLIGYHLEMLQAMGIHDVVVVVGYQQEQVRQKVQKAAREGVNLRFVEQPQRLGIAHALSLTREITGKWLVVVMGDTYFLPGELDAGIDSLFAGNSDRRAAVLSVRRVKDPELIRRECTVRFDESGRLEEIREKPSTPFNDLKPCGLYFFSRKIFDAVDATPPSALRNEIEITDSIQTLVDMGLDVTGAPTVKWDRNITFPSDVLVSNIMQLRSMGLNELLGEEVAVHPEARLEEVIAGSQAGIRTPARLERVLLLPGAVVQDEGDRHDCIIGDEFSIDNLDTGAIPL